MNRSKDLRRLFREWVKKGCISSDITVGGYHRSYPNEILFQKDIRIYFYEWSDVNKCPKSFYTLTAFDNYLKSCGITLELYQRDIINNLGTVYVTCYTGTKNLNIRSTYRNLLDSMAEYSNKCLAASIQRPSLIYENANRTIENDGSFFG